MALHEPPVIERTPPTFCFLSVILVGYMAARMADAGLELLADLGRLHHLVHAGQEAEVVFH
jgi:hypothetical protein